MSTTTPDSEPATGTQQIVLPPGVTVQPGRQTQQTTGLGQVVQGTQYGIILPNGTVSSVFVPDSILGNIAQVQAVFDTKINQLSVVPVG